MGKPFTDKLITSLGPEEKKYYHREGRGFTLRVMPSGVKTFLFIYTHQGKRREMNLGNYPHVKLAEAREQYQAAYSLAAKGIDPQEYKKAMAEATEKEANCSFGHFTKLYLQDAEHRFSNKYWLKTIQGAFNNDLLPAWNDKHITEIGRRDVIKLLDAVGKRARGQVNNVKKAASGVFSYALERDYINSNPATSLNKALANFKQDARERYLDESEVRVVWRAINEGLGSEEVKRALKLILATAQRPGEVASMHRNEIDGEWWTIPKEKAKNGKEHMVYLTPTALDLIGDAKGYIFPTSRTLAPMPTSYMSQLVSQEKVGAHGEVIHVPYYGLARWTPHDLRRTARTYMAKIGIREEHCEAVLNHAKQGLRKVYNKYEYQEEKKAALIKWEAELLSLIK